MKKTFSNQQTAVAKQEYYQINKNQTFFRNGSFYILSGIVVCFYKAQFIVAYKSGHTFYIDDEIMPELTFVAKQDTHIISSDAYLFDDKRNNLISQLLNNLTSRLIHSSLRTENRISALFLNLGSQIGEIKDNFCVIPAIFTQKELASYTNVTREYYNALYKKWKNEGIITYSKRNWILNNWLYWKDNYYN